MQKKIAKCSGLLLVLLVLSGCAIFAGPSTEDIVTQRINARWAALIDGRLETAYTFETPEYKELYSFKDFRRGINGVGVWRKIDIENLSCEEKKCIATIRIYVRMEYGMGFDVVETNGQAEEYWIKHSDSGEWYHVSDH